MLRSVLYDLVVQGGVACVGVEDRDDLRCRSLVCDVARDDLKVDDRRRQVSLERQGVDAEHRFHVVQLYGISTYSGFSEDVTSCSLLVPGPASSARSGVASWPRSSRAHGGTLRDALL